MIDTPGLGRPQQDDDQLRHTMTVHDVGEKLTAAGVPRSERQIKRYCESGFLGAKKNPGPTGDQWFVAPATLPRLIGDLQQWQMQMAGRTQPQPAVTESVIQYRVCLLAVMVWQTRSVRCLRGILVSFSLRNRVVTSDFP